MKKSVLCLLLALTIDQAMSQKMNFTEVANQIGDDIADFPPVVRKSSPPRFPGDENAFQDFVSQTVRYPERALNEKIEGAIYVVVNVSPTGLMQIVAMKGHLGGGCEQEAMRVVSSMPCWKPALQNSEPVSCKVMIPIKFILNL